MKKRFVFIVGFLWICGNVFPASVFAEDMKPVKLPAPRIERGKPLMQALSERRSLRDFRADELPPQTLSDLLWAANGINRSDGRRTAPSAHNAQEIDIYVARKEALYLYSAQGHELAPILAGDLRALVGKQAFAKEAPLGLIFVVDREKFRGAPAEEIDFYSAVDTGYISQNVYLYCASEGLSTVALGWVEREKLAKAMGLGPGKRVILTQPVGYPKKKN